MSGVADRPNVVKPRTLRATVPLMVARVPLIIAAQVASFVILPTITAQFQARLNQQFGGPGRPSLRIGSPDYFRTTAIAGVVFGLVVLAAWAFAAVSLHRGAKWGAIVVLVALAPTWAWLRALRPPPPPGWGTPSGRPPAMPAAGWPPTATPAAGPSPDWRAAPGAPQATPPGWTTPGPPSPWPPSPWPPESPPAGPPPTNWPPPPAH